jgi:hypothetical protein
MINPKILPTVLIVIDVLAAIVYGWTGDWRRCLYWLFAGGLTYVVTW